MCSASPPVNLSQCCRAGTRSIRIRITSINWRSVWFFPVLGLIFFPNGCQDPAPDVMVAGGLGPRWGHGAGTEGSVVKRVLAAVEAPGGLGADGSRGPEGGGQVPHLKRHLQGPVSRLAARGLLVEGHSKQPVQLLVTVLPHVNDHLLISTVLHNYLRFKTNIFFEFSLCINITPYYFLSHLILSRLLLEALGPCRRHDEAGALTRYVGCCLSSQKVFGGALLSPVTTPNIWVFLPVHR